MKTLPSLSGGVLESARTGTALRYLLVLTAQEWFVRGAAFPLQPVADAAGSAFPQLPGAPVTLPR